MEQIRIALVRRLNVQRERPQWRPSGSFEHDGHPAMIEAEAAISLRAMWREQSRRTRELDHLKAQRLFRPVRPLTRVVLKGNDLLLDKGFGAMAKLDDLSR